MHYFHVFMQKLDFYALGTYRATGKSALINKYEANANDNNVASLEF